MGLAALNDPSWDASTSRHLLYLNEKLMDVYEGKIKRLMVFMPPRHGKSMLGTNYFPAWWLMKRPNDMVMTISHSAKMARQWGRFTRDVVNEWGPVLTDGTVRVADEPQAADDWQIEGHFGGLVAMGVGGSPAGRGAELLLIDDPVANQEAALSQHQREVLWEWWRGTIRNRLEPGGAIVLTMTRWHEDDLAGRILADSLEDWEVISFPAIAEEDELWDDGTIRLEGEALWPERWPLSELDVLRQESSSFWWSALFQQRPAPEGGGNFQRDWFRYFQSDDETGLYLLGQPDGTWKRYRQDECYRFTTVDPAFTEKETADYTAIGTWAVTVDNQLLCLDMQQRRMQGMDIVPALRSVYQRWAPGAIHVESGGAQSVILQVAQRDGLPIRPLQPDKSKLQRSMPLQAMMEGGKVYWRQQQPWVQALEDELLMFPNGRHDDQVDAAAYAAHVVGLRGGGHGAIRGFLNRGRGG